MGGEADKLQNEEVKLEDILKSIRGLIDGQDVRANDNKKSDTEAPEEEQNEEQVLELTDIVSPADFSMERENNSNKILSDKARLESLDIISDFTDTIKKDGYLSEETAEESVSRMVITAMKPMIKEWLDNNLPGLVEKIVAEEIRQLVPKK